MARAVVDADESTGGVAGVDDCASLNDGASIVTTQRSASDGKSVKRMSSFL
jgi:hypothetical protein